MTTTTSLLSRDRDLLARVLAGTLEPGEFHHADHVRATWALLESIGLERSSQLLPEALRRFANAQGRPELFHSTISQAYLLLIDERRRASGPCSWEQFAAAHPDLLSWQPSLIDRYYSAERLWSEEARSHFVFPDQALSSPAESRHTDTGS